MCEQGEANERIARGQRADLRVANCWAAALHPAPLLQVEPVMFSPFCGLSCVLAVNCRPAAGGLVLL